MSNIKDNINYCVYIGDTFKATLEIKQDNVAVDVSTYSFKMQIRKCKDSSTVIHELSSPAVNGIDLTDGANGIIVLTISSNDTLNFAEQNAVYDIFWTDNLGEIKTISKGNFQIKERITKN